MSAAALARARAAWPGVALDDARFAAFVAERAPPGVDVDGLRVEELYLACACLDGDPRALAQLETRYLQPVGLYVARVDRSPAFADDVRQALRTRLLLADGDRPPRLTRYSGRGPLAAWIHVCAVRTALNLVRGRGGQGALGSDDLALATADPDLRLLQARLGPAFRAAFAAALAALDVDERQRLRLHFLDGLSFTQMGRLYGVERSTVAKQVAATRERLYDETARRLREELRLDRDDAASLMRALRSSLDDLSFGRLLRSG